MTSVPERSKPMKSEIFALKRKRSRTTNTSTTAYLLNKTKIATKNKNTQKYNQIILNVVLNLECRQLKRNQSRVPIKKIMDFRVKKCD